MVIKALNRAGGKIGDMVSVNLNAPPMLTSAVILYLIPLAGLLGGVIAGSQFSGRLSMSQTNGSLALGFAGLILGFVIVHLISRFLSAGKKYSPVISQILKEDSAHSGASIAVDPVCGMILAKEEASESVSYGGKSYYFCHPGCRESFLKDPEIYLKK
jgi:YHS domain-containing protein